MNSPPTCVRNGDRYLFLLLNCFLSRSRFLGRCRLLGRRLLSRQFLGWCFLGRCCFGSGFFCRSFFNRHLKSPLSIRSSGSQEIVERGWCGSSLELRGVVSKDGQKRQRIFAARGENFPFRVASCARFASPYGELRKKCVARKRCIHAACAVVWEKAARTAPRKISAPIVREKNRVSSASR